MFFFSTISENSHKNSDIQGSVHVTNFKLAETKGAKQSNLPSAKARHRKASEPALPLTEQTLVRSTVLKAVLFQVIDQLTYRRRKAPQKF